MVKLPSPASHNPDVDAVNLTRLLSRLQQNLLNPDTLTEQRLRQSTYERNKVGVNVDYARSLLLRLERDAATIKVQTKKHEVQVELLQKRNVIERLMERLDEINEIAQHVEVDTSEGEEDLLGQDTPLDDSEEHDAAQPGHVDVPSVPEIIQPPPDPPSERATRDELFPPGLRSRHATPMQASETDTAQTTSTSTSTTNDPSAPTAMHDTLMSHNRSEQESLTDSMLLMAQKLRASSQAFAASLESEKEVVDRAGEGLEKNTGGLDAAQKRIGMLRRMSEGQGWWGRMMLYAWIFGLMFIAFFIVAFMPKLRF